MLDTILDYTRYALYAALIFISLLLFQAWDKEHQKPVDEVTTAPIVSKASSHYVPVAPTATAVAKPVAAPTSTPIAKGQTVQVKTDVLNISIDTRGGDIINAQLAKYLQSQESKQPVTLFNDDPKSQYIAESGLLSKAGPDTTESQGLYSVSQTNYTLAPNQQNLDVKLTWNNPQGVNVVKTYTFTRGSYEIKVKYEIANHSSQPFQGNLYTQLMRTNSPPTNHSGFVNLATFFGAAVSSPAKPFTKISFKDMTKTNLDETVQDGWAAMIQHYFISAWIPPQSATSTYYTRVTPAGLYTVGMIGQLLTVAPGNTTATEAKLYVGPAIADLLAKASPNLKLTIDYGWFWIISDFIFWLMQLIYNVIGNWGWAIVIVTVIIKAIFYPLSTKSFRSMAAMKKLQPKIEALKTKFGDDKQKLTQATLELYRQEKVNPMSGCLPILIQIPVFIALYWVLVESVQLRQAPFIFWIHDLSLHDPYYVLPVLMGLSMFVQQRLNPPPPDPTQAKVMMLMPLIFTAMFLQFPAGLMLYWFVNNTLSFMQQWYVMHKLEKETSSKKN